MTGVDSLHSDATQNVLKSFPREDRQDMVEPDGLIHVTCEYCSRVYAVSPEELEKAA